MERTEINSIGNLLASIRHGAEYALSVTYSALSPGADCRNGSMSVTIKTAHGEFTSEAVSLDDALHLVRAKIKADDERRADEKAKAEAKEAA